MIITSKCLLPKASPSPIPSYPSPEGKKKWTWLYHRAWSRASLGTQMVKNLPAMPETQVWSLGWDDPLEKGMATHSSILAWRSPWTAEPGRLQSMGLQRVGHNWATNIHTTLLVLRLWVSHLSIQFLDFLSVNGGEAMLLNSYGYMNIKYAKICHILYAIHKNMYCSEQ